MAAIALKKHKFSDLRSFTSQEWQQLTNSLIRIVRWIFRSNLQAEDHKDFAQDILLGLVSILNLSNKKPERENCPLNQYIFQSARNRVVSHWRTFGRSREMLAGDQEIDLDQFDQTAPDLDWVNDSFLSLKPQDRYSLEQDVFDEVMTIKIVQGDKLVAGRLYKRSFDARARFRSILLHSAKDLSIHIRHLNAAHAALQEAA